MDSSVAIQALSDHLYSAGFTAMASPCEILVDTNDAALAREIGGLALEEARRIEAKFSRYRDDSVVSALHQAHGRPITVDAETARLLDFARQCHSL
ncbi:MAG TPA: FAD:protein FMN transferase, partial [Burkholderiaceae bacterium]|nr:FAD:protein FMN transferase [Burkholderiaceae bacterium]